MTVDGNDCREGVVVAYGDDFRRGNGVVFVDDGDCAELYKAREGVFKIGAATGVVDVVAGN